MKNHNLLFKEDFLQKYIWSSFRIFFIIFILNIFLKKITKTILICKNELITNLIYTNKKRENKWINLYILWNLYFLNIIFNEIDL